MNPRKLLVLTAAVLALFAFILFFERRMPTTDERQRKGDLHWDLPADRVDSVRLELQQDGRIIELKKGDTGGWRLVKPDSYPADSFAVLDLARELAGLKRAGGNTAGLKPEEYGLKPPSVRATFSWTDEAVPQKKKSRTVEFGIEIPGMDIAAARVAGTETVLFVPSSVLTAVKKGPNEFRSKEVFGGSAADVTSVDIERGRGHLALAKRGGVWWLQQPVTDLADSAAATRLAEDLVALRAVDFIGSAEKENLATQGLAPPLFHIAMVDSKFTRSSVDFGATRSDGNSVYARRESQVLTVSSTIVEELSREAIAFREARLATPDRTAVTRLEGTFGDGAYVFTRADKGWTSDGKPIVGSAAEEALSAVLDLKSKSFLDDAEAAALKGPPPAATLKIGVGADVTELQLFAAKPDVKATVSRRPGAFSLPGDAVTRLQEAFRKASASVPTPVPSPARIVSPAPKKGG